MRVVCAYAIAVCWRCTPTRNLQPAKHVTTTACFPVSRCVLSTAGITSQN